MVTQANPSLSHIVEPLRHLSVSVDSLTLDPCNARKHDQRNLDAIAGSLKRFGQRFPIVVQRHGLVVRAGNGRLIAARAMGWTHIAAVVVDESDVEAVSFSLADNRTSDLSTFDDEALTALLQSLPPDLMEVTGFNSDDLQELINELHPPEVSEDDVPAPPDVPTTRPGTGGCWATTSCSVVTAASPRT